MAFEILLENLTLAEAVQCAAEKAEPCDAENGRFRDKNVALVKEVFPQADNNPTPGIGRSSHLRAPARAVGCSLFLLCLVPITHGSLIRGAGKY